MREEIIWDGTFDGRFKYKTYAMKVFEKHNEEVKRRVPPEKLLVYEVKEGWVRCASSSASRCPTNPSLASIRRSFGTRPARSASSQSPYPPP